MNWGKPVGAHDWRYISKRLVRETVQADEAGRSVDFSGSIGFGGVTGSAQRRAPDYGNVFDLAVRATRILEPRTTTLVDTRLTPGSVVRATVNLHEANLNVWRKWDRNDVVEVASFVAQERYQWGRVFLVLVGSAHNWTLDTATVTSTGRPASDARGLYELIADALEDENAGLQKLADRDRHERESGAQYRLGEAVTALSGSPFYAPRHPREVLFVVHDLQRLVELPIRDGRGQRLEEFALAIVGAPIWIRDAPPEQFLPDERGARAYQLAREGIPGPQAIAPTYTYDPATLRQIWSQSPALSYSPQWQEWDRLASILVDEWMGSRGETAESAPEEVAEQLRDLLQTSDDWSNLTRWFSDQAQSFGGWATELHVHPRRKILWWKYDDDSYVPSGLYGRPIRAWNTGAHLNDEALVMTDGRVVPVMGEGGFVDGDGDVSSVGVENSFPWAMSMIWQAARWRVAPFGRD